MSTPNRLQTYWPEVKQFMKKEWPLISEWTLNRIDGNYDRFLKVLKETYNNFPLEEAKARDKIQRFLNKLENMT